MGVGALRRLDVCQYFRLSLYVTMVSINKSFLYGIFFASITWTISLYLYWQLNRNELSVGTTTSPLVLSRDKPIKENRIINKHKWWSLDSKDKHSNYVNSERNIAKLQPINRHANQSDAGKFLLGK